MKRLSKLVILSVCVISLGGCVITDKIGELFRENVVEKVIENSTDEDVDVDYDEDGGMKFETDEGTWEVGSKASIPNDFPSDIPIVDYDEIVSSSSFSDEERDEQSYTIVLISSKSFENTKDYYLNEMDEEGWSKTSELTMDSSIMMGFEKEETRMTTIWVTEEDDQVSVTITAVVTAE